MSEPRFHTKAGKLTVYALRCGYTESKGRMTLHMEHNTFHVRGFLGDNTSPDKHTWGAFDTLTEARKFLAHPDTHVCSRTGSKGGVA